MLGAGGADSLFGGTGNDTITGGEGNDFMKGDAGQDVFIFTDGSGDDTVAAFEGTSDLVDLSGMSDVTGYLQGFTVSAWGPTGVIIDITSTGDRIHLGLVQVVDISEDDFIF